MNDFKEKLSAIFSKLGFTNKAKEKKAIQSRMG